MRLIILDRDGVINHDSDQFIKSPAQWRPISGSVEAIARMTQANVRVTVATNQSGVGRGLFDMATLNAIHLKMNRAVQEAGGRIDAIFYCPHGGDSQCNCRKPKDGMHRDIAQRFNVELKDVPVVGDGLRDLQAAKSAGALPILVRTGKGKDTLKQGDLPPGTRVFDDLAAFVKDWL